MLKPRKKKAASASEASSDPKPTKALWPIGRALTVTLVIGLLLVGGMTAVGLFLLGFPGIKRQPDVSIKTYSEVLKLAFGAVAGIAAAFALVISYRKQRVSEHAQNHAEKVAKDNLDDATERRVTELYGKAVEQLGHEKAAVRLGGLYSLARLGQAHDEHRQTVVDMICAYLRMPFQLPVKSLDTQTQYQTEGHSGNRDNSSDLADAESRQEVHVRLTAQRLLKRHLCVSQSDDEVLGESPETFWESMAIDLTGAVLIDFNFSGCRTSRADFREAQFSGHALFSKAQFSGLAWFHGAQFSEFAWFDGARFGGLARFNEVKFSKDAQFNNAQFDGEANFWARFEGDATFSGARFSGTAGFNEARFGGEAEFDGARFGGLAGFNEVKFSKGAQFNNAQFDGEANFWARFEGDATFSGARFSGTAGFNEARFGGEAWFSGARFDGDAQFNEAQFGGYAQFNEARFCGDSWFKKARFDENAWFNEAQFDERATFNGARFDGLAWFNEARFEGDTQFNGARFGEETWFNGARFEGDARFNGARFGGYARFNEARFEGDARFNGARFGGDTRFNEARFGGEAWFKKARFSGDTRFDRAQFEWQPDFDDAMAMHASDNHVWPPGWGLTAPSQGDLMARLVQLPEHDNGQTT